MRRREAKKRALLLHYQYKRLEIPFPILKVFKIKLLSKLVHISSMDIICEREIYRALGL